MEQKFSEFRESERSLRHEMMVNLKILSVTCASWHRGRVLVSYTRDSSFEYDNPFLKIILFLSLSSVTTFRENSIETVLNVMTSYI